MTFLLKQENSDFSFQYIPLKESHLIMILYYKSPENEGDPTNVFFDFHGIHERVKNRFPETTLYRLLRKRCQSVRYQNRDLYPYEDVMSIPEIYKELKKNG